MKNTLICMMFLLVLRPGGEVHARSSKEQTARFQTYRCVDTQGIGVEAFRILVPEGWRFEGGVRWRLDNPGIPAEADFMVLNTQGAEAFQVFPNLPFFWTNNQSLLSMFPVGSRYFGNEVRPPVSAADAITRLVLPRHRNHVSGLRMISQEPMPDLAQALNRPAEAVPGLVSVSTDGARVRVEYSEAGKQMEEEIYAVIVANTYHIQSMYGPVANMNWIVDPIFSFKAEKGRLKAKAKLFQTIAHSLTINPQWFNKYNQLVNYLIQSQIRQIHAVGQISKIISQTHDEISDMMMNAYHERQAVNDTIAENFSQYVRGVDKYHDPVNDRPVELPTGYENAWTNGLGDYIVSESPSFNPNIGSNQNWRQMRRQE